MSLPPFDPDFGSPRDIAAFYLSKGLQPLPAKGKQPAVAWKDYQDAPLTVEVFEGWYDPIHGTHKGNGNVGTLLGRASHNKFMVDLDVYKEGGEAATNWYLGLLAIHNNRQELETWEQITGGGGRQLFFECPPNWTPPNVATNIFVDIKGHGGFAMLPPSLHSSGKLYKWREGRSPDDIDILVAPQWLCDEIDRLGREHGGVRSRPEGNGHAKVEPSGGAYSEWGRLRDTREDKLTRFVFGVTVDWRRECPIKPTLAEQQAKAEEKYALWESLVEPQHPDQSKTKAELLEIEGRGRTEFWAKFQRCMDQWDDKITEEAKKPSPRGDYSPHLDPQDFEEAAKGYDPGNLFERLSVPQIKNLPDPKWLVSGLIIEHALGFIYGPPGCLKTFMALDLGLTFATGKPAWWGREVEHGGAVIYISSEGQGDLKFRIRAWEQHRKISADDSPFRLIRQSINFLKVDDVGRLLATVQAIADETKSPIAAVFVDTVSRVLPGSDENLQKDMTVFIAACDAVRQKFGATVIGIHHTSRAGNMRGSTVIPAAGDFVIEVRREPGAAHGSIFAAKVKAGEDGWEQQFKTVKVSLGDIGAHTSLVIDADSGAPEVRSDNGWPEKEVLRQVLAAISEQWFRKEPWCFSKNSPRCAATNISKRWRIKRKIVEDILAEWTAKEIITHETCDSKNHIVGYRKLIDL